MHVHTGVTRQQATVVQGTGHGTFQELKGGMERASGK
jgi:hypothetical protein